jgi:hypothetical protein
MKNQAESNLREHFSSFLTVSLKRHHHPIQPSESMLLFLKVGIHCKSYTTYSAFNCVLISE